MIQATDIGRDFAPAPRPTVVAVTIDDEIVVYDEESGALHLLDPIGSVVWGCFDGVTTLAQLAGELAAAFGAPRPQVEEDVVRLTRSLGACDLLVGVEGDAADDAEGASSPVTDDSTAAARP